MRLTTVLTTGLSASAALVLLTACGGSSEEESTAAGGSSSAAAAETTESAAPDDEAEAFCTEGQALFSELDTQVSTAGPAELPGILQQVVAAMDSLTPPAEIESDFGTLRDAYDGLATTAAGLDLSTPEGQSQFTAAAGELTTSAQPAEDAVSTWTEQNCATASTAPTS